MLTLQCHRYRRLFDQVARNRMREKLTASILFKNRKTSYPLRWEYMNFIFFSKFLCCYWIFDSLNMSKLSMLILRFYPYNWYTLICHLMLLFLFSVPLCQFTTSICWWLCTFASKSSMEKIVHFFEWSIHCFCRHC